MAASNTTCTEVVFSAVVRGSAKNEKFQKSEYNLEVGGWVQVSLGFLFGKSSQNIPKPVLICWSSIPCVLCLYICIAKSCWLL